MSDRDHDAGMLDDARALMDAFIENDWSTVIVRTNGRDFSFSRDTASGGLNVSAQSSETAAEIEVVAGRVTAPHVGTVVSLASVGAVVAKGETVVRLSVLDEIVEIPATSDARIVSHGIAAGTLAEFGQVLIELAT